MKWVLPEYIEDILPAEAARIESLRRKILDLFFKNKYELVMPPLLEYVDSLLTGTGHDLELRTFKVVDQLSGRMMGLRADITPQVARIDIGHVAVFRAIAHQAKVAGEREAELFEALQRKDLPEIRSLAKSLPAKTRDALLLLPNLWRDTFRKITQMTDGQIRFVGLSSMIVGLLLLLWARA